ncbi:MAG TPA: MFS transporter [Euzebya sp.]|nr:MFS transporter [Euzebya sp.]
MTEPPGSAPTLAGRPLPGGPPRGRPWRAINGLGIATIVAYGGWFYGFGVLLQAIADDTGWSVGFLGSVFAAGQLAAGFGAIAGGRLLDRVGGRPTFLLGGIVGGGLLGISALAPTPVLFAMAFTVAAGLIGGTGFYHATMAAARRLDPLNPVRTIAPLTIWGAFASPIFLPLTAVLVQRLGWRPALGILAVLTAVGMTVGAAMADGGRAPATPPTADDLRLRAVVRQVLSAPAGRRLLVAIFCTGVGGGMMLAYQVPIMVSLGLPLGTAASVAGARGFLQLGGRVGLERAVGRFGARRLLAAAGLLSAVAITLLAFSGNLVVAALFAATAGVAIGAGSPLTGIHAAGVFPDRHAGALLGALHTVHGAASAAGPLLGAVSITTTGSFRPALGLCGLLFLTAAALLWSPAPDVGGT